MDIEYLNLSKSPYEGDKGSKEKVGGNEPIQHIIHISLEMSMKLCIDILNKQKCLFQK
jgi:hypothetical protein